jgi:hypothetical protein
MGGYDDVSIESDFSLIVKNNKNKNNFRQTMKTDTRYEKYGRLLNKKWSDGRFYEYVTIENYGSGSQGSRIRNAVTGTRYNIPVGDLRENMLFKVMDSTGRYGRKDTLILYYDSPEQYENHHFVTVSPEIKKRWHERNLRH